MELIETLRKATSEIAQKRAGKNPKQPTTFVGQVDASNFMAFVMSLPVDDANHTPLQDQSTGEIYHMIGLSALGTDPLGG